MSDSKVINVLHVVDKLTVGDATINGVAILLSWCIPRFDKRRFRLSVCSLRGRDKAGAFLEGIDIKMRYLDRGKFDPRTLRDLIHIIKREEAHILHLHGYGSATFGRAAALLTGLPCIVHEHMYDAAIPFYQQWADRLLRHSTSEAIAVSRSVKDFMVRLRSIPEEKVRIIYNGVPLEEFETRDTNGAPVDNWRRQLGIPTSHSIVAIVGRLHPIKGHRYFLEAARQVLRDFKDATFLVIGDGDLMFSLREQCRELRISDQVIFTGYVDDLSSLLPEVDVKVIASLSEGIPLTLFEAMAAGCGIVCSDVGGLSEVLEDGKTGFLVPPKDPQELARKLLILLKDPELSSELGRRARGAVREYDIAQTVQHFQECYEEIFHDIQCRTAKVA